MSNVFLLVWIPASAVVSRWNRKCCQIPFRPSHRCLLRRKEDEWSTPECSFPDQQAQQRPFIGSPWCHSLPSLSIWIMFNFSIFFYLTVNLRCHLTNRCIWILSCPIFVVRIYSFLVFLSKIFRFVAELLAPVMQNIIKFCIKEWLWQRGRHNVKRIGKWK